MDLIRGGQDCTPISSGRIWPVVIVPVVTALRGIVLFVRRGTGMTSDRTEVTVVPSVLAGSVRRACSCQSRHAWLGSTSPCLSRGRDRGEVVRLSSDVWLRHEGVVMADPGLSVRSGLLGLVGPRPFGLSLAGVLRAA